MAFYGPTSDWIIQESYLLQSEGLQQRFSCPLVCTWFALSIPFNIPSWQNYWLLYLSQWMAKALSIPRQYYCFGRCWPTSK